jgi:hypothetical protein
MGYMAHPNIFQALAKGPLRPFCRPSNDSRRNTWNLCRCQCFRIGEKYGDELCRGSDW